MDQTSNIFDVTGRDAGSGMQMVKNLDCIEKSLEWIQLCSITKVESILVKHMLVLSIKFLG